MAVLNNNQLGGASGQAGGYFLEDSLRFRSSASAYLSRTPASDGNRKTFTVSMWVKRGTLGVEQKLITAHGGNDNNGYFELKFSSSDQIYFGVYTTGSTSTAVFRDTSAWYHVVLKIDTTQASSADRVRVYINNIDHTVDVGATLAQDTDLAWNRNVAHSIGRDTRDTNKYIDSYITEVHNVDGTALAPTDFGETDDNGTWIPKKYTGSYGTNGFYLPFKNNSSATFVNTFNGSSQSLSVVGSADMALGTGDCTVECYFKVDSLVDYRSIIDNRPSAASSAGFSIDINANGSIYNYSDGFIVQSANGTISAGQYYHVAYTRASGTHRLFVDGIEVATSSTSRDYTNDDIFIGRAPYGGEWFDGEISNVRIVKGTAVYTSNFTPSETNLTAVTNTKLLTCQSATIVDNSGLSQTIVNEGTVAASTGNPFRTLSVTSDQSGNINNWVSNNINLDSSSESTYDLMSDVPTLTNEDTNNFATLNPNNMAVNTTMTDGNLKASNSVNHATMFPTNMPTTGKYYFECKMAVNAVLGLGFRTDTNKVESAYSDEANKYYFYLNNSNAYRIVETTNTALGANLNNTTSTFQVAIDFDAAKYYFGRDNTWYAADWGTDGDPASGTNPSYDLTDGTKMFPFLYVAGGTWTVNFGQQPFAYTPPTGFKKINTFNLPDSTIEDGSEHFDILTWSGNGAVDRAITGLEFQPDFTWIKSRSNAVNHWLMNSVNGARKGISSNNTGAEQAFDQANFDFESFDSNGFSVSPPYYAHVNTSGHTFVGWNWKGSDSTAVSNTDGTITSTVSANPTAGFSIATWTNESSGDDTVGHGLGVAPKLIITKLRSTSGDWYTQTTAIDGGLDYLKLNNTNAAASLPKALPTADVFTTDMGGTTTAVAYCFAEVEGYSKIDKYTGNGSTDGPFVYTGFRPSFIIFKRTDSTDGGEWKTMDSARTPYNWTCNILFAHTSSAENTSELESTYGIDLLANGFKVRSSHGSFNASGGTYMYMAFAENPFKNSNAR